MSENSEKLTITLLIDQDTHQFIVPRNEEATYRAAAQRINDKFARYRYHLRELSLQKYNALVLTSLAADLLQEENKKDSLPFLLSMEQLTREIEEALGESPSK